MTLRGRLSIAAAAVVVVMAIVWMVRGAPGAPAKTRGAGVGMPVVAAGASKGEVKVTYDALGAVTPLATITVKTQINGQLMRIGYQEGQIVHQGDFLAEIDPRPFEAALKQAEGALARDEALLEEARIDQKRYETLVAQDSIAQQQFDTQKALVHQYEGTVKIDQGVVDTAKVNLLYTHITAPVTGRVGLRLVDPGNYVQTSDAGGVVVITQMDPISVIFSVPEDNEPQIMARMLSGATLEVTAFDRSGTTLLATGKVTTIDNQIDTGTGTVKLRALFDNKDLKLFPSQFVNARLLVEEKSGIVVLPNAAIQRNSATTYVWLVKPDQTVTVRQVSVGVTEGDQTEMTSGVAAGDEVVTVGVDRLVEGSRVNPQIPGENSNEGGGKTGKAGKTGKGKS
jgi:multidrug efflux system membrane fusion protein